MLKKSKVFIYIIISLLFIFISAFFFANRYLTIYLKEKFSEVSQNTYQLSFDNLSINILNRSIIVSNIKIQPFVTKELNTSYSIFQSKSISILNISISSLLFNHEINLEEIKFVKPEFTLYLDTNVLLDKYERLKLKGKSILLKDTETKLSSIFINKMLISNLKVYVYKLSKPFSPVFTSFENSFHCSELFLSKNGNKTFQDIKTTLCELSINNFNYVIGNDSLYSILSKRVFVNFNKSSIFLDSLKLIPNYSKKEFSIKANNQITRAAVKTSSVLLSNVNFNLVFKKQILEVKKIAVNNCNIDLFRDNNAILKPIVRLTVQEMIKLVPFFIDIDSVNMNDGELHFEARQPNSFKSGKIYITKMNIFISNLKNDTTQYMAKQQINVNLNGFINNTGKFSENYIFPLNNDSNLFYCFGGLSSTSILNFNSLVFPVKHLAFVTGQIDTVSFNFVASKYYSNGEMKFYYHNLKIELLNKYNRKGGLLKEIKSILANNLLLYHSNPIKNVSRTARIYYKNNTYRYFINYAMQSIISGIEPSIMINPKK